MRTPRLLVLDATDDLRDKVESATAVLRPRPEVLGCIGFDEAYQTIAEQGPFDLVIAGPMTSTAEGLKELRRLRLQIPQTNLILAFDRLRSGSLRETVRTGALDILRLPVADDVIVDVVEQALEVQWALPLEIAQSRPRKSGEGTVFAVVSATGGCGKTFFATNLAYHLQTQFQKRTCLIDLDLQFGELSTALRLKPRYTIADLMGSDFGDGDVLGRRLEEFVARHDTGIEVLAAPEEPAQADAIEASDVARVIDAAKHRFDCVVIDTPASLSEAVLVSLEHADQVFAIATLDLPSVRNLGVLLATFKQLKVPSERVHLVLNKVEPDVGIDVAGVTRYFPQGFSVVIPYGREVNRSLNMGMPMLAYAPRGEVGKALSGGLAATLQPVGDEEEGEGRGRRRSRRGRRKRKSA